MGHWRRLLLKEFGTGEWLAAIGLAGAAISGGFVAFYGNRHSGGIAAIGFGIFIVCVATALYVGHYIEVFHAQDALRATKVEGRATILAITMGHYEIQDLSRRGSYDRIPRDLVTYLKEIERLEAYGALATNENTRAESGWGRSPDAVRSDAQGRGLTENSLDHSRSPAWSIGLTSKGMRLLEALKTAPEHARAVD
jgi:hypothetical protein